MASLFSIFKTFRPRRTILSEDFNSLQITLASSFDKIGTEPPSGFLGVSSPFHCADPTDTQHAVTKGYLEAEFTPVTAPLIEKARQWAEQTVDTDVNGIPGDRSALHYSAQAAASAAAVDSIRYEDAAPLAYFLGQS